MKAGSVALLLGPVMRDLLARVVAYAIASLLLAIALGFLVATLYLGLREVFEPPFAALLTALALAVAAAIILVGARYRRPRRPAAGAAGADALLLSLREQVQRDPWSTLALAAVLGALAELTHSSSGRPPS